MDLLHTRTAPFQTAASALGLGAAYLTSFIIYRKSTEATLNWGCFQSDGRKGRYLPSSDPETSDAVSTVPSLLASDLYRSQQDPEFTPVPPSISNRQCVLNRPVMSDSLRPPGTIAHQAPLSVRFSREAVGNSSLCLTRSFGHSMLPPGGLGCVRNKVTIHLFHLHWLPLLLLKLSKHFWGWLFLLVPSQQFSFLTMGAVVYNQALCSKIKSEVVITLPFAECHQLCLYGM